MGDNIKQVVKDVKFLIATDCNDETIQARIEDYIKERVKCEHKGRRTATELVEYCEDCKKILYHP